MKRQLPQWMLGVPSNHQNDSGDSSRNSCNKDIEDGRVEKETKRIKKRKQSSRNDLDNDLDCEIVVKERKRFKNKTDQMAKSEEKAIEIESKDTVEPMDSVRGKGKPPRNLLVKCKERKRTKENVSPCGEVIKNKKNGGKAKGSDRIKNCVDVASTDCLDDEDDIDLTVEDLMIIANEYIQEDNNSKQVKTSKKEHMSVNQSQGIAESSSSRGVLTAGSRFIESTERNHCCNSNVDPMMRNGNSFDSENPTQSMLDLFLGPWLKKTQEEEEKKSKSKTSDLDLEFEAYKQKSVLVEEKPVTSSTTTTLGKKKSSLKDKVMMFLD